MLRLYRGDSTSIDQFEIKKTNKFCLLGQGIYLTDRPAIAKTYRSKDASYDGSVLCDASFANKEEAKKKAFGSLMRRHWYDIHGARVAMVKEWEAFTFTHRYLLEDGLSNKTITCLRYEEYVGKNKVIKFKIESLTHIPGEMTVFEFPKLYLERNIINIDALNKDAGFLEIMDDPRFWHKTGRVMRFGRTRDKTKPGPIGYEAYKASRDKYPNTLSHPINPRMVMFEKLIPELKTYGVIGFEYSGGLHLGGAIRHRAFSLWDEQFVNDHIVLRNS